MTRMVFRRRALRALALATPLALLAGAVPPPNRFRTRKTWWSGNAVLIMHQFQRLLAKSAIKVVSGRKAKDIDAEAALSWVSANTLTLDAFESVTIDTHVSDDGSGGHALVLNDGGTGGALSFRAKGDVTFLGTTNSSPT